MLIRIQKKLWLPNQPMVGRMCETILLWTKLWTQDLLGFPAESVAASIVEIHYAARAQSNLAILNHARCTAAG